MNGTAASTEDAPADSCLHPSDVCEPLPGAGIDRCSQTTRDTTWTLPTCSRCILPPP